jgi:hypothetical protein
MSNQTGKDFYALFFLQVDINRKRWLTLQMLPIYKKKYKMEVPFSKNVINAISGG